MKTKLLLTLLLSLQIMYPQHKDVTNQVQQLISRGRDHIINIALEELQKNGGSNLTKEDFHFIKVLASDQRILISFGYNVIYLQKNDNVYSAIEVELPSKLISMGSSDNGGKKSSFYHPTKEKLAIIDRIINITGVSDTILKKNYEWPLCMTIKEDEDIYTVDTSSRNPYLGGGFSIEEIDKKTGEIRSAINGHYEPAPFMEHSNKDNETFIEVIN